MHYSFGGVKTKRLNLWMRLVWKRCLTLLAAGQASGEQSSEQSAWGGAAQPGTGQQSCHPLKDILYPNKSLKNTAKVIVSAFLYFPIPAFQISIELLYRRNL